MGMGANWVIECEEKFFDAVQDVCVECDTLDEVFEVMQPQRDLVKHMTDDEVDDIIGEIWFS